MKPEILTRTERILIEEECDFIQDPNPLREVYEQRIQRMYEQQIL